MPGRRFPHLGWTLDRWRDPPQHDHRDVRPYGPSGVLITEHAVGLLVVVAVLGVVLAGLPETRLFFSAVLLVGMLFGLVLRLRHR